MYTRLLALNHRKGLEFAQGFCRKILVEKERNMHAFVMRACYTIEEKVEGVQVP